MKKPASMSAGMGLGLLGGIVAVASLGIFYDDSDAMMTTMAVYLLAACLYFALGGAFSDHGQWSSRVLTFMGFVTFGIVAGGTVAGYYDAWFGVIEGIIAALIVVIGLSAGVKNYVDDNKATYRNSFRATGPGSLHTVNIASYLFSSNRY